MIRKLSVRRDPPTDIRQEQPILVSGLEGSEMATGSKYGLMVHAMRETGRTIEHKALENSLILMEIFTRATGSMTRQMGKESTFT